MIALFVLQSLCIAGNQVVINTQDDIDTAAQIVVIGDVTGATTDIPGFSVQLSNPNHPGGYSFQVYGGAFGQFSGRLVLATIEGTPPFSLFKEYVQGGATQVVGYDLSSHAFYDGTLTDCDTSSVPITDKTFSAIKELYR